MVWKAKLSLTCELQIFVKSNVNVRCLDNIVRDRKVKFDTVPYGNQDKLIDHYGFFSTAERM